MSTAEKRFDEVGFIVAYESGELTEDQVTDGFQHLIDNGMAWKLQGSYGRQAMRFIHDGLCHKAGETCQHGKTLGLMPTQLKNLETFLKAPGVK